ncbi:response regulator [Brucella cytisi]|uniref:response regulator n=1 Tax=Brucella cytisi TaxID=407152 RepID=UPI0035D948CA
MVQSSNPTPQSLSTGTVLIVDDEQDLLRIMAIILSEADLKCLSATMASEALDMLRRHIEIDVIVSDLRMPEMDGLQFLENVRREFSDRPWLQFLFVTGHGTLDSAVKAMKLQAADFIHKPIRRAELLVAVETAKERSVAQRKAVEIRRHGEVVLSRLSGDIARLSEALGITNASPAGSKPPTDQNFVDVSSESNEHADERILEFVKAINLRDKFFSEELFVEPVWRMLCFLLESGLTGEDVYLTDLYNASGVSPATAARRVAELKEADFIIAFDDNTDKRRQRVVLSADAFERLLEYINGIIAAVKE